MKTAAMPVIGAEGDIRWELNRNSCTLSLVGEGAVHDYDPCSGMMPGWTKFLGDVDEIVIADGITRIGNFAFFPSGAGGANRGVSSVLRVAFPSTLQSIGHSAFRGNTHLQQIDLHESKELHTVGSFAFASCLHAKSADLSWCEKLETIDTHAFANCSDLAYIDLTGCVSLSSTTLSMLRFDTPAYLPIIAPNGGFMTAGTFVKNLEDLDAYCHGLRNVEITGTFGSSPMFLYTLKNGVLTITGNGALPSLNEYDIKGTGPWHSSLPTSNISFSKLVKYIVLTEGITGIGDRCFYCLPSLQSVSIPSSMKQVGRMAFGCCENLQSLDFSKCGDLRSIGIAAFAACPNLEKVTLPDGAKLEHDPGSHFSSNRLTFFIADEACEQGEEHTGGIPPKPG